MSQLAMQRLLDVYMRAIASIWNFPSQQEKGSLRHRYFLLSHIFVANLSCLTWFDFCPFRRPPFILHLFLPSMLLLSFTYAFFKSHPGLAGMSHRSSVPSGAAPVILRGHVHLSKQWMRRHPQAGMRGLSGAAAERTEKQPLLSEERVSTWSHIFFFKG